MSEEKIFSAKSVEGDGGVTEELLLDDVEETRTEIGDSGGIRTSIPGLLKGPSSTTIAKESIVRRNLYQK